MIFMRKIQSGVAVDEIHSAFLSSIKISPSNFKHGYKLTYYISQQNWTKSILSTLPSKIEPDQFLADVAKLQF